MAAVADSGASERQYHNTASAYVLPNDAIEQQRLDAQAAAIVEMIGGQPFLAPISALQNAAKAVDVGCGTGVATVQMAGALPATHCFGLDISSVPEAVQAIAPKNTSWAVCNVLDVNYDAPAQDSMSRDIFTRENLDYIFGRMLFLGISNWQQYFDITSAALKSGGIIEHQDLDWKFYRVGSDECLSDSWEWHKHVVKAAEIAGLSTKAGSKAAEHMKAAGLEIVSTQTFEFSFVPSAKTPNSQAMGRYVQAKLVPNYPELLRKMLGSQGIEGEELARLTKQCLHDIGSEEGVHQKYTVTLARKI